MLSFQPTQLSHLNGKVVLNYKIKGTLGEGAFGKVKLAVDPESNSYIAIKIISKSFLKNQPNSTSLSSNVHCSKDQRTNGHGNEFQDPPVKNCKLPPALEKEVAIHKAVKHPNIIRLIDYCGNGSYFFLLMEWASAGELFDKIVPDVGLAEDVTHFFFRQLASAVSYLHQKGIAHRDLKPENMLLDAFGNLKLTDFGFATIFKHNGKTRKLNSACGSPVYLAPEVLKGPYDGDAADLWSMGVILFVMFTGAAPWTEPTPRCYDFGDYLFSRYDGGPLPLSWQSIPTQLRALLFKLVAVHPLRGTMATVHADAWFRQNNALLGKDGLCVNVLLLAQKMCEPAPSTTVSTQPEFRSPLHKAAKNTHTISSFSQPSFEPYPTLHDKEFPSSFFTGQPLTRFFTLTPPDVLSVSLAQRFADLHINYTSSRRSNEVHFHFDLMDAKRCPIQGHVHLQSVSKDVWLVLFIRKKGDPLEFKKVYLKTLEGCTWNVLTYFSSIEN